jgi:uncharacterized protein DUF3261
MRNSAYAMVVGAALAAPLPGCASLGLALSRALPDQGHECPGPLVPTEEMLGDFVLRQNVRVQGEGLDWALTLVSQKRGPNLVLVGLDPFGAKLFTLTQQGTEVTVERPRGRLPLPPVNLLRDLHRTRFLRPGTPPEPGVTIASEAAGTVRIRHAACGYDTTLVTVKEDALAAP